jgi:hypothetical protein
MIPDQCVSYSTLSHSRDKAKWDQILIYTDMWNLYERSHLQAPLSSDLFCFRADSAEIYE